MPYTITLPDIIVLPRNLGFLGINLCLSIWRSLDLREKAKQNVLFLKEGYLYTKRPIIGMLCYFIYILGLDHQLYHS